MRKLNPLREKAQQNALHASRFPRRSRRARKQARRARVLERELRWLDAMGLEPNETLLKRVKKAGRR